MQPGRPHLRTAPSAGALYPLDVYVAVRKVEGVPQGLHHYDPDRHALAELLLGDPASHLAAVLIDPAHVHAAVWVILAASFQRSRVKYGLRAFRFVLLEAGHIAQNVLLAAAALNLTALPIGGFFDSRLDAFLMLDGLNESALYLIAVGSAAPEVAADP
jgi:SagB-type dehydrogenase family enzyme